MTILDNGLTDKIIRQTLEKKAEEYYFHREEARKKQDEKIKQYLKQMTKGDMREYIKYLTYYNIRKGD